MLIIYDQPFKPYTLQESFKGVNANNVYTRTLDNNTPKNKSCDIYRQEQLWKERFGLDVEPKARVLQLMKDRENWENDIGSDAQMFYKFHPEYTIQVKDYKEGKEAYNCLCPDTRGYFGNCEIRYNNTLLMTYMIAALDGFRYYIPVPKINRVGISIKPENDIYYYSYINNEVSGALQQLVAPRLDYPYLSRLDETIIFYQNHYEKERFETFVKENIEKYKKLKVNSSYSALDKSLEKKCSLGGIWSFEKMAKLRAMYDEWKS